MTTDKDRELDKKYAWFGTPQPKETLITLGVIVVGVLVMWGLNKAGIITTPLPRP